MILRVFNEKFMNSAINETELLKFEGVLLVKMLQIIQIFR